MDGTCTVVVCSCDKYADVLLPFSALFRKFWPDCPFETVLVAETEPEDAACFDRVVACGHGMNWASRLERALGEVNTPFVLMLCDDYFLSAAVDTPRVMERLAQARDLDAACLRLVPNPKPSKANSRPAPHGLREYRKNTAYCISTLTGFWNRDFLRALAGGKASIWEFERLGSFQTGGEKRPLLVTPKREFPFVDAVHKGHWEKSGLAACRENGVVVDLARRGLPPLRVRAVEALKTLVFAIAPVTPLVRLQNALGLGAKERRG